MSALEEEIRRGESDVLEFKRELPVRERQFLKTVVAFANGKGGKILFGVDNATHEVLGVEAESRWEMQDRITDMISNSCSPQIYPNCDWVEVGGKPLLLLSVPAASNCPYYIRKEGVQKGTYVRVGATTRRAEPEKIRELEMYGEQVTYDSIIPRGVAPVTSDEVNYLCKLLGEMQKEGGKKPSITQLVNWGFVRGEGEEQYLPTNAFLLLVGRHFPFAGVQCARFKGNTQVEFIDRKMLEGSLYEQYRNTLIFLRFHLKRSTIIRGALREDQDELPVAALREAVANAIVHRNYLVHGMIKVSVFDDRVEISSPGTLYANLSEDEMMQGVSRLRNPLLAECFHKLGVIERWGGGVRRIYDLCRAEEIPDPVYHIGDDSITVVFRRPGSDGIEREAPHQGKNSSSGDKLRDSIVRLIREIPTQLVLPWRRLSTFRRATCSIILTGCVRRELFRVAAIREAVCGLFQVQGQSFKPAHHAWKTADGYEVDWSARRVGPERVKAREASLRQLRSEGRGKGFLICQSFVRGYVRFRLCFTAPVC